ncbi:ribulokinase [Pedobacter nyackensis]|uniref:Ribulokinase n=1 Tax=Pedobacter nyackensis TaxID=475255 RepID=A0A1W2D0D8_9SPHI|nr:ribulokinase [Pedobacter nyackensis]SMC91029.1 L-ribulokinase [Pedobacter nyackensis]
MESLYVIGLDYGTDSARALLVDAHTGKELATAVHSYSRWKAGKYCDTKVSQFRQHPKDYIEAMELTIKEVLAKVSPEVRENIKGISIDTTGSTPVAVDKQGCPLALLPQFADNPNAMFVLWKDHTANIEAQEINALAKKWETDFTKYAGGIYSSEWFWSKILHILRVDAQVAQHAFSWVEHCDWMPALLTGNTNPLTLKRSRCAAGHKAMWHPDFDGLPAQDFLTTLDPRLSGIRDRLYSETYTSDESAGTISVEWADRLGLSYDVLVGVGALDAHFGAVGAAIKPYTLVKVMGTSTCDMLTVPAEGFNGNLIKGICGQVDGSIVPGMIGMEAGQSAFGDYYYWFQQLLSFPIRELAADILSAAEIEKITAAILPALAERARELPVTESDMVALDWINGRRTPDANLQLKAAIMGLGLGSDAAALFKAFVEATAFGSKAIVKRFEEENVPINEVIAIGGIAKKSSYIMQTLADILNVKIAVATSEQVCALGAAMFASTASGIYPDISTAQRMMNSGFDKEYYPDKDRAMVYEKLYEKYEKLGNLSENFTLREEIFEQKPAFQ